MNMSFNNCFFLELLQDGRSPNKTTLDIQSRFFAGQLLFASYSQHCERKGIRPMKTCATYLQNLSSRRGGRRGKPADPGSPGRQPLEQRRDDEFYFVRCRDECHDPVS